MNGDAIVEAKNIENHEKIVILENQENLKSQENLDDSESLENRN